ncbi:MAG TPA: hypothetical protein PKN08_10750, partial [Opitutaceae bacterium]|nr:hypothetical protein [Opitutaceae bacterium]
SKLIWEAFSHSIAGIVVDLGILILVMTPALVFEVQWLAILSVAIMCVIPPFMAVRAVRKEMHRQKELRLDEVPSVIHDPVLGDLRRWENDPTMWEAIILSDGGRLSVVIDGEGFPDPVLLQRAYDLARNLPEFLQQMPESVLAAAKVEPWMAQFINEIRTLKPQEIIFYGPAEPESTEVYFESPHDMRCWRASVRNLRIESLGCET